MLMDKRKKIRTLLFGADLLKVKRKLNILFLLALSACGSHPCANADYWTKMGSCVLNPEDVVDGHKIDLEQLDYVIESVQREMFRQDVKYSRKAVRNILQDTSIRFVDDDESLGVTFWDEASSGKVFRVLVTNRACLAFSSLQHEILHVLLIGIGNVYDHPYPIFSPGPNIKNYSTVEAYLHNKIKHEWCEKEGGQKS
jgi:hypothetical protein